MFNEASELAWIGRMQSENANLAGERARHILIPIMMRRSKNAEIVRSVRHTKFLLHCFHRKANLSLNCLH